MKVYNRRITEGISGLVYNDFDMEEEGNVLKLRRILDSLFLINDPVFFYCMREDDFLSEEEVLYYRKYIPSYFKEKGNYHLLQKLSDSKYSCMGAISYDAFSSLFIIKALKYFYSINFFKPRPDCSWEEFIKLEKGIFVENIDGVKILKKSFSSFIIIKGLGQDSLLLNYLEMDFEVPKLCLG